MFSISTRDSNIEAAALLAEKEAIEAEEKREAATISFDIFSSSPTTHTMQMEGAKVNLVGKRALKDALLEGEDPLLQSNWDDGEGYYKTRIGDIICDR